MPTVSIIVPVYNCEKYLPKCIESILNQSYSDFELILINDGSKDNSRNICCEYQNKDNRIKFINQNNMGVSSARNNGLDAATGMYVTFIDSDDVISRDYLSVLLKYESKYNVDLVCASFRYIKRFGRKEDKVNEFLHIKSDELQNQFIQYFHTADPGPWGKLFIRQIIEDNKIRFQKGISVGEDRLFNIDYYSHANSIVLVPDVIYYYNCTNSTSAMKTFHSNICDFYKQVYDRKSNYLIEKKLDTKFHDALIRERELYFEYSIEHYILHVTDKDALTEYIKKTADLFLYDITDKYLYSRLARENDIENIINQWKRKNRKTYYRYILKRYLIR